MIKSAVIEICHLTFLFFLLCSECDVLQTDGALCQRISSVPWFTGWQRDYSCHRQNNVACRRLSRNKLSKSVVVVMGFCHGDAEKEHCGGGGGYGARRFSYLQYLLPRCSHPCYSPIPHSPDFSYGMHEHAVLTLNHMLVQWHLHVYRDTNLCIILGLNIVSQRDRFFSHRYHPWRFFTERVDFRFLHQFCRYELSNDSYGLFF